MTTIREAVLDIISHTEKAGGIIDCVRVKGTSKTTNVQAVAGDTDLVMNGVFMQPVAEFIGEFGMGNLKQLNCMAHFTDNQDEHAEIKVVREDSGKGERPSSLVFSNPKTDSRDEYRFMDPPRVPKFKGADWHADLRPTKEEIERFLNVAQIYSENDETFLPFIKDGCVIFKFGNDESPAAGVRTFANDVKGNLTSDWRFPLSVFLKVAKLALIEDCEMHFSEKGVAKVKVDSSIARYEYIIPSKSR